MDNAGIFFLVVFVIYLVLLQGVGVWGARRSKSGEDFLMAGRTIRTPILVGTTLATLVGTGSSLGAAGFAYSNGWAGALYGIGGAAGIFALFLLFADTRKYNFMTFPEELAFYYRANKYLRGLVSIVLFIAELGWLGAHILGGATYLSYITGINLALAKIIIAVGFGLYTVVGGYLAVIYTDAVQGIILFVGFTLLAVLSFYLVGGRDGFSNNLSDKMTSPLGIEGLGVIPAISLALVIAIGVLATPSYRQRIYSALDTATVKRSYLITGVLFAIFAILPAIAGMSARVLNPDLQNSDFAFPYLATQVFPLWIGALLLVSGLSATMSSASSDAATSVTILLRDVYRLFTGGRLPQRDRVVWLSRVGLTVTLAISLVFSLLATTIIGYITLMISVVLTGLFVAALLGKFWSRVTWQGGVASIVGGAAAALVVQFNESLTSFWGNPVIPSLVVALAAGVVVSLITPVSDMSAEQTLKILDEEREAFDAKEELTVGGSE